MSRMVELKVDTGTVDGLVERLGKFDSAALVEIATDAVNMVATHTYDTTREQMTADLSLTDSYVTRKVKLQVAKPSVTPRAAIVADGSLTTLGHYSPSLLTQPVKHPNRSKGHSEVGLAPGQKRAGVTVEVKRGSRKEMAGAFTLPGKKDNEGNPLIFVRNPSGGKNPKTGKPKVTNLYGPSVYQVFNSYINDLQDSIGTALVDSVVLNFEKKMEELFS